MSMNREDLINNICMKVGTTTQDQIDKVHMCLNDVVLNIQLQYRHEILISEMSDTDVKNIIREVVRRYRYG